MRYDPPENTEGKMNRLSKSPRERVETLQKVENMVEKTVQTSCDLHLKLRKWRDAAYCYDTVPKIYTSRTVSPSPGISLTASTCSLSRLPSRAIGHRGFTKNGAHDRPVVSGEGWIFVTCLVLDEKETIAVKVVTITLQPQCKVKFATGVYTYFHPFLDHIEVFNINHLSYTNFVKESVFKPKLFRRCRI